MSFMSKQKKEEAAPQTHEEETKEQNEQEAAGEPGQKKETKKKEAKKEKDSGALKEAQEELQKQKDSYMRLAAEYDNYRKRTTAEKLNIYADATAKAVSEILVVADSLEAALKSSKDAPEEFRKGLELVNSQFTAALQKLGVEAFGEAGEAFDPQLHNAVSKVENEELGENAIAMVFQKGYKTGDKIIRHAMVQVANCD